MISISSSAESDFAVPTPNLLADLDIDWKVAIGLMVQSQVAVYVTDPDHTRRVIREMQDHYDVGEPDLISLGKPYEGDVRLQSALENGGRLAIEDSFRTVRQAVEHLDPKVRPIVLLATYSKAVSGHLKCHPEQEKHVRENTNNFLPAIVTGDLRLSGDIEKSGNRAA